MKFLLLLVVCVAGCGESRTSPFTPDEPPADAAVTVPVDAISATPPCFTNPQTHEEIINACTDAQKIYKDSRPPLLGADGSLPPLP